MDKDIIGKIKINFDKMKSIGQIVFKRVTSFVLASLLTFLPISVRGEQGMINNNVDNSIPPYYTVAPTHQDIYEEQLGKVSTISQSDDMLAGQKFDGKHSYKDAGCGPISMVNALTLAFNIEDRENILSLVDDVIDCNYNYTNMTNVMANRSSIRDDTILRRLKSVGKMRWGGTSVSSLRSEISKCAGLKDNTYIFGTLGFSRKSFDDIIGLIRYVYDINPDTNIIFYKVSAGMLEYGSAFGSKSNSGHYITVMINVREFVENNTIYVVDSMTRNIGDCVYTYDGSGRAIAVEKVYVEGKYSLDYNFLLKPRQRQLQTFNETFDVFRVSEQIIKVQKPGSRPITAKEMGYIGIEGGCGVIVCSSDLSKTFEERESMNNKSKW